MRSDAAKPARAGDPKHTSRRRTRPDAVKRPPARLVLWFVSVAVPLTAILVLMRTQPFRYDFPGMDLSRRLIFIIASVLELYGAGMIGFALGATARSRLPKSAPDAAAKALALRRRVAFLVIAGALLMIVAGRYEYLALTDKVR